MVTDFIKYCPVCGSTDIDTSSYGSDGHAQCCECKTRFTVDAISVDKKFLEDRRKKKQRKPKQ